MWCSRAAGGPNLYIGGIVGCCSASFDLLTMGSQCHPYNTGGELFVIQSPLCERYLVVLSCCGRPKSRDWWYWEMLLSEFFDRLNMGSQRHPLAHRWEVFPSYKVRCASDIWVCSWAAAAGSRSEIPPQPLFCGYVNNKCSNREPDNRR